jgi:hypothetical protein
VPEFDMMAWWEHFASAAVRGGQVMAKYFLLVIAALAIGFTVVSAQPSAKMPDYARHFVILVHETPEEFALRSDTSALGQKYWQPWGEFHAELEKAGILRGGMPLQLESTAKHRIVKNGQAVVADGPLTPASPQWSGFFIIEVDDMKTAMEWAAKVPNASTRPVEVRHGYGMPKPPLKK